MITHEQENECTESALRYIWLKKKEAETQDAPKNNENQNPPTAKAIKASQKPKMK